MTECSEWNKKQVEFTKQGLQKEDILLRKGFRDTNNLILVYF